MTHRKVIPIRWLTLAQLQAMSEPYTHALVRRELVRLLALRAGLTGSFLEGALGPILFSDATGEEQAAPDVPEKGPSVQQERR